MRYSEARIENDIMYSKSTEFINLCKEVKLTHFTRYRKMPLKVLLLTVLFRKGRTLQMELRIFKKLLSLKESISKVGYLKQRLKLNPLSFLILAKHHTRNFYKDSDNVKKKNGYLILAVDGSNINVPTNDATIELYGNASSGNFKTQAQIGISCLYDTLNKMVIDCSINRFKFSEREQALLHIENMQEVIGRHKSIIIFDRGYPSGEFFVELIGKEQKFLVRLPSTTFKREQQQMRTEDCGVEIVFDSSRLRVHNGKKTKEVLAQAGKISLRFVRIKLPSGEYEYLATNLPIQEFSTAEISMLYSMRWGIETVYDDLKNKLFIENFTGTKPILIEQDIYASIYLLNISNDIILEAQIELQGTEERPHKHQMAINKNIAFGIMERRTRFVYD